MRTRAFRSDGVTLVASWGPSVWRLSRSWAVVLGIGLAVSGLRAETTAHRLAARQQAGDEQRVQVEVRIEGHLKLNADGKAVRSLPLKVSAEMRYVERLLEAEDAARRSIRSYDRAEAEIRIGDVDLRSMLRSDRRVIGAAWGGVDPPVLFSPVGPLTQEELDLVDIQANSLCLAGLLPSEPVRVGEDWKHAAAAMAGLLNLDAVVKTDARSKLLQFRDEVATVELSGTVDGVVGGVATEIRLQGQWEFDLRRGDVTRLQLSLREERAIGHSEPGFEVDSRIDIVCRPFKGRFPLDDETLQDLELLPTESNRWLLLVSSQAGVRFVHDRQWRVMADHLDGVVLRRVEGGELIAQCNLVPLRKLPAGQRLSLEQFQADVKRTLGERFGQLIEAAQTEEEGVRVLRVTASGTFSDLPIRWIYYHLTDAEGNRGSIVFTLEESLVERFGGSELPIVRSLEFLPVAVPSSEDDSSSGS